MDKYALTVENLTKVYSDSKNKKENKALNNLNFYVKQGEIFGLLGPNGAGKTTFLSILGGTVSKTKVIELLNHAYPNLQISESKYTFN